MPTRFKASPATGRGERGLLERLGDGWSAGQQLPPVRELAEILGVAPGTAHRAVRNLTMQGLLTSRPRTGVFVTDQYTNAELRDLCHRRKNPRPQTLRGRTIEVVYAESLSDTFVVRMAEAFVNEIQTRGGRIRRHTLADNVDRVDALDSRGVDGFAVVGNLGIDDAIVPGDVPMVWVTANYYGGPRRAGNYDVVSIDQPHGGMVAADALRRAGCRHACVLGMTRANGVLHPVTRSRLQGFSEAWDDKTTQTFLSAEWYGQIAGAQSVADYLAMDPRPTGIFAVSDELAVGFVHGAAAHGLVAGRDYAIVGFDGQDIAIQLEGGPLTTVGVPILELGRRAAEALEARLTNEAMSPQRILLRCRLIEGPTARFHT